MFKRVIWAAAAVTMAVTGCDKDTETSPTSKPNVTAPAAPATVTNTGAVTASDPLANIVNRDQLTLDPNATKIDPPKPAVLVTGLSTSVRQSPRGSRIQVLETTASVKEVERDGDYFLVTYADPKGSNQVLAGWVYRDSLVGEASAPIPGFPRKTGKLACASGTSHLRTTQDFCGKTCDDDHDCDAAKGQICDGVAFKINEKSDQRMDTRYCIPESAAAVDHGNKDQPGSKANTPAK